MNIFYTCYIKRILDLIYASIGLTILFPILFIIGILIKLNSKGPIFYKQTRIGKNFKPFKILKFRTMIINADKKGLKITTKNDLRITKIGKILRKTKLDELPQLINVIKGDLALVGPRPEVKKYVTLFKKEYKSLLMFRPGITDNAAIAYIDEESLLEKAENPEKTYIKKIMPKKLKIYNTYIQSISFLTDTEIILKTILKIIIK